MAQPFCYDRRYSYFDGQDVAHDHAYAMMRHPVAAFVGDDYVRPAVSKPRRWYGLRSRPKNSKPLRKDHRYGAPSKTTAAGL